MVRALAMDKVPYAQRLHKQGRITTCVCALCGQEQDDFYHRLVECPSIEATQARETLPPKWLHHVRKLGRRNVQGQHLLFSAPPQVDRINTWDVAFEQRDARGQSFAGPFAFEPGEKRISTAAASEEVTHCFPQRAPPRSSFTQMARWPG